MKSLKHRFSIAQTISLSIVSIVTAILLVNLLVVPSMFSSEANDLVTSQAKEINKQIIFNYERYIESVIETAEYLQTLSVEHDIHTEHPTLQQAYTINSDIKADVIGITLFDIWGKALVGREPSISYTGTIAEENWFTQSVHKETIFHFSAPHLGSVYQTNQNKVLSVSRLISYVDKGQKRRGVLLIELNFEVITRLAELTNLGEYGHLFILNDDDSLIYSSAPELAVSEDLIYPFVVEQYFGNHSLNVEGVEMAININTLSSTRWRIVTVNNINSIHTAMAAIWNILIVIIVASLIITALISIAISTRITKPLKELEKSMLKIEQGHLQTKVHISGQKELMVVAHAFNTMAEEIELLMARIVAEQKEKRETELQVLQNQINPHFLYNTLDSIVWLAEHDRSADVITTVTALAKFFRISISRGNTIISVQNEVSHITSYLIIQKIRYATRFNYHIDIDPEIYPYSMMKLLLQPLVENALYHGVHDETETITITGRKIGSATLLTTDGIAEPVTSTATDGIAKPNAKVAQPADRSATDGQQAPPSQSLIFEVTNTGYGLTQKSIDKIHKNMKNPSKKEGVGMKNVYRRIKLYYGESADITVSSELDEYTRVTLTIPAILAEHDAIDAGESFGAAKPVAAETADPTEAKKEGAP